MDQLNNPDKEYLQIITDANLKFLEEVDLNRLTTGQFTLYKQLVCLAKLLSDSQEPAVLSEMNFEKIFGKFEEMDQSTREYLISGDPATKTSSQLVADIEEAILAMPDFETQNTIQKHACDDFLNLVELCITSKE